MDLNFDGGAVVDPPGKEGLASVCMAMLTEGTEQLDKLAYAEALADTASSIGGYAGDDSVGADAVEPGQAPRRDVRAVRRHAVRAGVSPGRTSIG